MSRLELTEGFAAEEIPEHILGRIMGKSYKPDSRIKLTDLSYLTVTYKDFNGETQTGEMICKKTLAKELLEIFYELFEKEYPIEKIRLVDEYDADDDRAMADNNSSCFNYRVIADTNVISLHGQGRAVDINPLYNPYIVGEKIMPPNGAPYADRTADFPYKIDENDICLKTFKAHGWLWGGDWDNTKDYQHFYKPTGKIKGIIRKIRGIH